MSDALQAVERFIDAVNASDLDALTTLMTEDHVFIDSTGQRHAGRTTMREGWASYFESYPDYRILPDEILQSGEAVAVVGRTSGSHIGPDVEQDETVVWIANVLDGRVSTWRVFTSSDTE